MMTIDNYEFTDEVAAAILLWFEYKKEKRQFYRNIGRQILLKRLYLEQFKYSPEFVVDEITHSIECNYAGIYPAKTVRTAGAEEDQFAASEKELFQEEYL